jgi:flagellin
VASQANYTSSTAGAAYVTGAATATVNLSVAFNGGTAINLLSETPAATDTAQNVADAINSNIAANTSLHAAGLNATASLAGVITIASTNGTSFQLSTAGSTSGATGDVGFGTTNVAAAVGGQTASNAASTYVDSQGVSNSTALTFNPLAFGSDEQSITVSANGPTGTLDSKTINLTNANASGQSIDAAVSAINQALQETNDPTLQNVVAVKEDVSGVEKINFLSSNNSFSVSVGSSANGNGFNGTTTAGNQIAGNTTASDTLGTGTTVSIDTQANAIQAVAAIANAVTKLGTAQAAVGTGENQLNYAIGLAQSQITNFTAAESRIRDADVAADAASLTKAQTLQQAGVAALAQANSEPQAILHLLQ